MPRFTSANARENAAKAHAARLQRLASGKLAGETFPQTPQVGPHEAAGAYVLERLSRVRLQLDLVDKRITEQVDKSTVDGQVLNQLCAAQERLAEQERRLSNRPLPGSRRPAADKAPRRGPESILVEEVVSAPVSAEPPTPAPTTTTSPLSAPGVGPVSFEYALRHRPAPLPAPASTAPPSQKPG